MLSPPRATQPAFAADGPSPVFIEVGLCTLGLLVIEVCVAAAEMQALGWFVGNSLLRQGLILSKGQAKAVLPCQGSG